MEKLVRDKIPEIIRKGRGEMPPFRTASPGEYRGLLALKLREEVGEYLSGREPMELADILEVVYALAEETGLTPEKLEEMRRRKAEERGNFSEKKVMNFFDKSDRKQQ